MRIVDIKTTRLWLPERRPEDYVLVRVETDEDIVGWGEASIECWSGEGSLAVKAIIDKGLRECLMGEDPLEVERLWEKMYDVSITLFGSYGRRGIAICAMSGIDVALMDIKGKAFRQQLSKVLGGPYRDKVKVYASALFDMEKPEKTIQSARKYIEQGFKAMKFGWGQSPSSAFGLDMKKDIEIIKMIRNTVGDDIDLMVDAGRFVTRDVKTACKMARNLEKYDVFWLEEPLPPDDIEGYALLRQTVDIPIAAGEVEYTRYGFRDLIVKRALDILQPDITRAGGLSEVRRIAEMAQAWNMLLVPHSWSTAINVAASLHLVASMKNGFLAEFRAEPCPWMDELLVEPFKVINGCVNVPKRPGLGVEIDERILEKYASKARY